MVLVHGIRFFRAGAVKEQADQDAGFTLAAGIGTVTQTAGASMRMQGMSMELTNLYVIN